MVSKVLRPSRIASVRANQLSTITPMSASENGTSHPPWPNPPLGSSSAPPGPCMTPSSVRNVCVTSFTGSSQRLPGSGAEDGVLAPVPELPRRPDLEHTVAGRQPPIRVTARC